MHLPRGSAGGTLHSGIEGTAQLCIDPSSVQPILHIRGLRSGEVYTAWLAYFDRPSACFHIPCGFHDLQGDDPPGGARPNRWRVAPESEDLELQANPRGLHPSTGAHVTLMVLSHGVRSELDGRTRARQLLTPQMFELGAPMAGALRERTRGWLHAQVGFTLE